MGDLLTLEKVVNINKIPFSSTQDILKQNFEAAEQTLNKIPKKTLPIEQHRRELAREMYADSKYEKIDLSFLSQASRTQDVDFSQHTWRPGLGYDMIVMINSAVVPLFGLIDFETEDKFMLEQPQNSVVESYVVHSFRHRRPTQSEVIFKDRKIIGDISFSATINYRPTNSYPKYVNISFPMKFRGRILTETKFDLQLDEDEKRSFLSYFMKDMSRDDDTRRTGNNWNYLFPKAHDTPIALQLPDDARAEYERTKKLGVFDRYLILFETKDFKLVKADDRRIVKIVNGDPVLLGCLDSKKSVYIVHTFYPTVREELITYANSKNKLN